jgi:hypothetical protein
MCCRTDSCSDFITIPALIGGLDTPSVMDAPLNAAPAGTSARRAVNARFMPAQG